MNIDLTGKAAIVTGAGQGIGRAVAIELAARGASVVINDLPAASPHDASTADHVVDEIRQAGGSAATCTASIASWDGAQEIVATAMDRFGRLDLVVNNAGNLRDNMFHKMAPEDWRAVVSVHLDGYFYVSRAAAPIFRQAETGSYVHFTSTSGLIGTTGQVNYGAAKAGIAGMSKQIAIDMRRYNVRSNCVSPFAWTQMTAGIPANTPEQKARVAKFQQMLPEKIAPLVAFLGSDDARDVNGQIFAMRNNEVFLMSQSRPLRSMQRTDGWSAEDLRDHMLPAFRNSLYPLDQSIDVFSWDPV